CEMAARAGTGIELDLSLVPQREQGMTAYEMLLSESQERMLIVAHRGREREVVDIFRKWDLDAVVIGRVRDGNNMLVIHNNETVADIPVSALTDEAPLYTRPMKSRDEGSSVRDEGISVGGGLDVIQPAPPTAPIFQENSALSSDSRLQTPDSRLNESLLRLVSAPNIASKEWVYRQYDHMVRTNTVVMPGADAAVVRIKETRRALAMCLDGNGRYCAANPREGARLIVAEAARNVVCVGARPIAITNCLNFASPERPEVMWSFSEVIDGIAEACRAFNTPVVSGNVSFYNETEGRGILPTPVIGMVGLIEDVRRVVQHGFKAAGDIIALLGTTDDDLSISEYAATIEGRTTGEMIHEGRVPALDLDLEKSVQATCLRAAESGLLRSAHDCSDGGLSIALAECCFSSLNREAIGAEVDLAGTLGIQALLFSESPSRIIISFGEDTLEQIEEIAQRANCPFTILGRTGGKRLSIKADGEEVISLPVAELEAAWRMSLVSKLHAEVMTAA
nr:phosphoribosylformylglycinamidine synthase II [Acidobacteriota bacterium]